MTNGVKRPKAKPINVLRCRANESQNQYAYTVREAVMCHAEIRWKFRHLHTLSRVR